MPASIWQVRLSSQFAISVRIHFSILFVLTAHVYVWRTETHLVCCLVPGAFRLNQQLECRIYETEINIKRHQSKDNHHDMISSGMVTFLRVDSFVRFIEWSLSTSLLLWLKSHSMSTCQTGLSFKFSGERDGGREEESEEFRVLVHVLVHDSRKPLQLLRQRETTQPFFPLVPFRQPYCAQPGTCFQIFPLPGKSYHKLYKPFVIQQMPLWFLRGSSLKLRLFNAWHSGWRFRTIGNLHGTFTVFSSLEHY